MFQKKVLILKQLQNTTDLQTYQTTQVHRDPLVLWDDQETAAGEKSPFSICEDKYIYIEIKWEEHCS